MLDVFEATNNVVDGKPAGGSVSGTGLSIAWQNGPLGAPNAPDRKAPNGAFVETVIAAAAQRIEHYQQHFPCRENALALTKLEEALHWLDARTKRRSGLAGPCGRFRGYAETARLEE